MADTTTSTATADKAGALAGYAARGKVKAVRAGSLVFAPSNTTYELHLAAADFTGPLDVLVDGVIRGTARKAWTVPSGGNFLAPIFGPPRIVQGRVVAVLDDHAVVIRAGAPVVVELPESDRSIELTTGPIAVGALLNVTLLPGARFELVGPVTAK
jgi:hypothetical protein